MNILNPKENYPKLISYMEESQYSSFYIKQMRNEIQFIISEVTSNNLLTYNDIYQNYVNKSTSKTYLNHKLSIIGTIKAFDELGQYPNRRKHCNHLDRNNYQRLSKEFKDMIDFYVATENQHHIKKETTIYHQSNNATSFLLTLQQCGCNNLEEVTQDAVLSVFLDMNGSLRRSCTYKKGVSVVLKKFIVKRPNEIARILSFLPELRQQ
jgi:hypothetical protein